MARLFSTLLYLVSDTCNLLQISPVEVENVIRQHPGVLDVAVTGIPDPECGDLPVACVVVNPGFEVTALEIKDLVKGLHYLSLPYVCSTVLEGIQ